ncbi:hypothetical protein CAL7102_00124 [Dulcicalothrix desertica PCC 7102]|nr:hypothetical protein CAL7102_00124 [Dulcicalothrix desertica PCC 7102]
MGLKKQKGHFQINESTSKLTSAPHSTTKKAPPPHFLHILQWQAPTRLLILVANTLTAPHKQLHECNFNIRHVFLSYAKVFIFGTISYHIQILQLAGAVVNKCESCRN